MTDVTDRAGAGEAGEGLAGDGPPARSHVARNASLAVGAVLMLLIAVLATREPAGDVVNPLIGHRVPALAGPTLDGSHLDVDTLGGKWVVVNFLASWCIGCVEEHPDLLRFAEAHRDDARIVGVAYNDSPDNLREFFRIHGGDWPVILSEGNRAAIDFGVTGVPESFVVRPDGLVVNWNQGITFEWLEETLAAYRPAAGAAGSGEGEATP